MNETDFQSGRLEALSLILGGIVAAQRIGETRLFGRDLVHLVNQYLLETPLDSQRPDFRVGFQREVTRIVEILDVPEVELYDRLGRQPRRRH